MGIHNSGLKKDIVNKFSVQVYRTKVYKAENFQNNIIIRLNNLLEHFIKIIKNNNHAAFFFGFQIIMTTALTTKTIPHFF